jgi:hypothetical protein
VKTTALTTLHEPAELPQLPIATCPVDRRNQVLLISQSLAETTSEFPRVHQYQDWTTVPGLDTKGITPELLPYRLNF